MNNSIRTDLALEMHEFLSQKKSSSTTQNHIQGVTISIDKQSYFTVTHVKITSKEGELAIGKPIGNYITIELNETSTQPLDTQKTIISTLSHEISNLIHIGKNESVLVIGLGNKDITPDSLGPSVISKLMITRHIIPLMDDKNIRPVCAVATGVLGTTGIETLEIVKGIVEKVNPSLVIVVDALAARSISRIGTTIQLSDTGICPGSGVGNNRKELSQNTLHVPVMSIGIPTVIDRNTMISDILDSVLNQTSQEYQQTIQDILSNLISDNNMIVTPKEIDSLIQSSSEIIASGLNDALLSSYA